MIPMTGSGHSRVSGAVEAPLRFRFMPSTAIRRFEHDPASGRLRVTFVSGAVYEYEAVPDDVVAAFRAAPSRGRFFSLNIRDRYPFRRCDGRA
jgi:hypothetical protein